MTHKPITSLQGISPDMLEDLYGCLYRIGRLAENIQNPDDLLRATIEECQDMFDCEGASIAIYSPETDDLTFSVVISDDKTSEKALKQWRIPVGKGIIGLVAKESRI